MFSAESFHTRSLDLLTQGAAIRRILAEAVRAVEPGGAVRRFVQRDGRRLVVAGKAYDLDDYRTVALLGLGKASQAMAAAASALLSDRLDDGLVISKHAQGSQGFPWTVVEGGHPVPDDRSLQAGEQALALLERLGPADLLVCLISGGGSALLCAPPAGVTLADLQSLTAALLACGAPIDEINALRRRLDRIKGGGVAALAHGATVISLILSDVVGNPLEAIASGPTAPDPTTRAQALAVLDRYGLRKQAPGAVRAALEQSAETPKPGDPLFEHVQNVLVGSNLLAAQAGLKQAREEGFHPYLVRTDLQGEARQAAFELATFLRQTRQSGKPAPPPACLVAGGETTVTLRGRGRGGRNTELALAAAIELAGFPGVALAALATDGEDGPTDAAGAFVTGETHHLARKIGLSASDHLERNDSYTFFSALGDLFLPGPSGTNVNDLVFLFTF